MVRFVILAAPRTGSNLLCTLLHSHPQVLCHHELFNPQGIFVAHDHRGDELAAVPLARRDADPLAFLDRIWRSASGPARLGFKWTRGQDPQVLQAVIQDSGVRKIVLRRRNRIKTFVSERIAQATNQWEVYAGEELLPRPRIRVELADLLQHIAQNQHFYDLLADALDRSGSRYLELDYEDLFEPSVQRQLLEFLDVASDVPLVASSVKQNRSDLRESITNFADLELSLADTQLQAELHDCGM